MFSASRQGSMFGERCRRRLQGRRSYFATSSERLGVIAEQLYDCMTALKTRFKAFRHPYDATHAIGLMTPVSETYSAHGASSCRILRLVCVCA